MKAVDRAAKRSRIEEEDDSNIIISNKKNLITTNKDSNGKIGGNSLNDVALVTSGSTLVPRSPAVAATVVRRCSKVAVTLPKLTEIPCLLMELGGSTLGTSSVNQEAPSALTTLKKLHKVLVCPVGANSDAIDARRKEAVVSGAIPLLVLIMRSNQHNQQIQGHGCWFLTALGYTCPETRETMASLGCVEAIFDAMQFFPGKSGLQKEGLAALVNIFADMGSSKILQSASTRFVQELDGVRIVATAMKGNRSDVDTQRMAGKLFGNLAVREELRNELITRGAVSAVGMALELHSKDADFIRCSSNFMKRVFDKL